ncbi:peptidase S8/S53 domain-containing protein [Mycena leptocephala]|nr:peptidase S8/S53 domain-containing protein [Mycena leptocephala]
MSGGSSADCPQTIRRSSADRLPLITNGRGMNARDGLFVHGIRGVVIKYSGWFWPSGAFPQLRLKSFISGQERKKTLSPQGCNNTFVYPSILLSNFTYTSAASLRDTLCETTKLVSVTAVGATESTTDETEETASEFSGGGFSNFFKCPRYQDTTVAAYLKATNNTRNTAFNLSGRAVPDLSAIFFIDWIIDGELIDFFESPEYSATIFASMIALLTNERIAAKKPGLGFLNPLLYANPGAFNDMKTGNNPGCNMPGFNATSGWDPVTGFGSPSFPKLQKILSKL